MIFLVVMPTLSGFANYFVPLMIGARDMAFPRLNAFAYWMFPFGGFLLHWSLLAGGAPNAGWVSYAPLSETPYSSTMGTDYWVLAVLVLGIGSVATALNVIATVPSAARARADDAAAAALRVWMTFVTCRSSVPPSRSPCSTPRSRCSSSTASSRRTLLHVAGRRRQRHPLAALLGRSDTRRSTSWRCPRSG